MYYEHPLVMASEPGTVWPFSLYLDAVPFSKLDSLLGFFLVNEVNGARHLLGTLRKSSVCRCGCKAWCSLWPVLRFLWWSVAACMSGRFPSERHDHKV